MKVVAHCGRIGKLKNPCKILARALKRGCRFIFSRGMNAVVGGSERIVRMGGKLYHGEIRYVHEMFAVMVILIRKEAVFD